MELDIPLEDKPLDLKWMYNFLKDSGYEAIELYKEWNHNNKEILQITHNFDSLKTSPHSVSFSNKVLIANNPFVIANYYHEHIYPIYVQSFGNMISPTDRPYQPQLSSSFLSNQIGIYLFLKRNTGKSGDQIYNRKLFVDVGEFYSCLIPPKDENIELLQLENGRREY